MGVGAIRELSESVPTVLREPSRLYRSIMRDADDQRAGNHPGWLCYVGKPHDDMIYGRKANLVWMTAYYWCM